MDVLSFDGGVNGDERRAVWVAALEKWIGRDAHPRFIVNPNLNCLWMNDAAQRLVNVRSATADAPVSKALLFFDQRRLKSLLDEAGDDLVHWRPIPDRNGEKLIVWAKAIGDHHGRLFGLVLMPPDYEQNFREFFLNARLTPAEARVINAVLHGKSLASTAVVSGVSKETIKTQLKNAYRKLNVTSRGELFAEAHRFLAP
jgi:DNA-binding CsgD family transcriptional regulator